MNSVFEDSRSPYSNLLSNSTSSISNGFMWTDSKGESVIQPVLPQDTANKVLGSFEVEDPGHTHPEPKTVGYMTTPKIDLVNHPPHYNSHPSGVECITVARHMGFNLGNAIKYLWRADEKGSAIEDLKKALWYIQDEINKREGSTL